MYRRGDPAGESIRVVTVGGSSTFGKGAAPGQSYPHQFIRWLRKAYPGNHTLVNNGLGATPSSIFNACLRNLVDLTGDLYVVEFAMNDPAAEIFGGLPHIEFEQLLRRILNLPTHPAVIILNQYSYLKAKRRFENSAERHIGLIAKVRDW